MRKLFVLVAILLSAALPLVAQFRTIEVTQDLEPNSPECALGLKYDSGVFGSGASSPNPNWIGVMRFDLPAGTTAIRQICVRLSRANANANNVPYDIMIFDDNGQQGRPGTVLKTISGVAVFPAGVTSMFVTADLSSAPFVPPDSGIYVGIRMSGGDVLLLIDTAAATPARTLYFSDTNGFSWSQGTSAVKAFFVRVDPIPECVPSATALCLNNRFKVEATFTTSSGPGTANVVKLTDETGYLWFFSSTNVEAVVKVLNGCGLNNSYWVFAGGLTDVNTTLKVTDVRSGVVKTYTNPQGTPFQPIQDVNAFPGACP